MIGAMDLLHIGAGRAPRGQESEFLRVKPSSQLEQRLNSFRPFRMRIAGKML